VRFASPACVGEGTWPGRTTGPSRTSKLSIPILRPAANAVPQTRPDAILLSTLFQELS
jgi:hypothetical protein